MPAFPVIMVQHWQRYGGIDDIASRKRTGKANWRWLYEMYLPPNPAMDLRNATQDRVGLNHLN